MEAIIGIICALMGIALGFVIAKGKTSKLVESAKADALASTDALKGEVTSLQAQLAIEKNNAENAKQHAAETVSAYEKRIAETKADAAKQLQEAKNEAAQHENAAKLEREEDFNRQLKAMEDKFQAVSERLLKERSEEFKGANKEQMEAISKPLLVEIENMRKQMGQNKEGSDKSISELKGALQNMLEQSAKLSKDAEGLTRALKGNSKVQGDWGEQVLENILQNSGLRENLEFFKQKSFTGKDGKEYRPDVIVKAADGTQIIVDSKVSLTAYANYNSAQTDEDRDAACKANLDSVWKHVEELAKKNYPEHVPQALPYVLMFVPNEGSYILALNKNPKIGIEAYNKGVIIINPTNLMLALSLILRTWQNTRQNENCAKIMKAAKTLYEKFCTFSENFAKIGDQLNAVTKTYDEAKGQLNEGRGNIISQFNGMQKLGLNSTKQISEDLTQDTANET